MAKQTQFRNPFYALLLVAGIIFSVTACAYCVMAFRAVLPGQAAEASLSGEGLMQMLDRYGVWIFVVEIAVLAVAAVGAITTDDYWMKRGLGGNQESSVTSSESQA
jgi:multisubunit Na+/H+ antiporter MnhB subunit